MTAALSSLDQARQVLRQSLVDSVSRAEMELRDAQDRLRKFDEAMGQGLNPETKEEKIYQRGRTILVRNAINKQNGAEFTPEALFKTIQTEYPNEAWLVRHITDVTKVLIKLTESGSVIRLKQGAGLKAPIYQLQSPTSMAPTTT